MSGIKTSLTVYRSSRQQGTQALLRTGFDAPFNMVLTVALLGLVPVFFIFYTAMGDYPDKIFIATIMSGLMLVFRFIFSSVAGYMVGLVGSSNNPISGVTIAQSSPPR